MTNTTGKTSVSAASPPKMMRQELSVSAARGPSFSSTFAATREPTTWAMVIALVISAVREALKPRLAT